MHRVVAAGRRPWLASLTRQLPGIKAGPRRRPAALGGPAEAAPPADPLACAAAARQDERLRVRRDLHDSLAPGLAVLNMRMEVTGLAMDSDLDQALALFAQTRQDIRSAIADLRQIIRDLGAPVPAGREPRKTLSQTLADQVKAFEGAGAHRLRLTAEIPEILDRLPAAVQLELQRIVGEAVTNVVRHSRASVCHIGVDLSEKEIDLQIRDNGIGISARTAAGIGLPSMCLRTRELGGIFSVEHNRPHGTVVRVRLPVRVLESGPHHEACPGH